jgi:hypothetical protein
MAGAKEGITKAGTRLVAEGAEDKGSLETLAVVGQATKALYSMINELLDDAVVTMRICGQS